MDEENESESESARFQETINGNNSIIIIKNQTTFNKCNLVFVNIPYTSKL